jgi:predicted RNA-binding Zn-ribbon protein involved in translation (DUF1610 family)
MSLNDPEARPHTKAYPRGDYHNSPMVNPWDHPDAHRSRDRVRESERERWHRRHPKGEQVEVNTKKAQVRKAPDADGKVRVNVYPKGRKLASQIDWVCPNCGGKTVVFRSKARSYLCRRCGHEWVRVKKSKR